MGFRLVGDGWLTDKGKKKAKVGDAVVKLWKYCARQAKACDSKPLGIVIRTEPGKCFVHWVQRGEHWEAVTDEGIIPLRTL